MLTFLMALLSVPLPHDPRLWPNQPGFWSSLGLFILYGYTITAYLGDSYYTGIGLSKGLTEGNPINRWLFSKIGQALATFIEAVAITFIGLFIASHSYPAAYTYWGIVAAVETYMVWRNRKLLGLSF